MRPIFILSYLLVTVSFSGFGFTDTESTGPQYTLSGYIRDAATGEELIGATVYIGSLSKGTITNSYGFYSISLPPGTYAITFSFIGYEQQKTDVTFDRNKTMNIELIPEKKLLKEVVVRSTRPDDNVVKPKMSTIKMESKSIQRIPALLGEVDIIKAIQLLPGVQTASEGSSGFIVRGGSPDQNLIVLDEATVYNASHLLGFFSVFNNDAVKDITLYKGDIPPSHGGRLSSLLDVRMKEGNSKNFSMNGGVGSISSRLTIESPIVKNRSSFIISGRRSYADIFLPFAKDEDIRDNTLYFYDLNAKVNTVINENNRIFISGYFGRDIFKNEFGSVGFGNRTATLRWNHLFSQKLFANFTFINSLYDYEIGTPPGRADAFLWKSVMKDHGVKLDFTWFAQPELTLRVGASTSFHLFEPGIAKGLGSESLFGEYVIPRRYALQHGIYTGAEHIVSERITLKYGLRWSVFQNTGKATVYYYNNEFIRTDSAYFESAEIYNTYHGAEPRLGLVYQIDRQSSLKSSYSRTRQYIHLAQNSTAGTPLDLWFASGPNVKPQIADQLAVGYFRNFRDNTLEASVELYYKNMQNTIDFKDHANLLLNKEMEAELRFGKSWSYGIEMLLRVNETRLNGWISYTYSRSQRKFKHINRGETYPSPYDRPHDIAIVLNYDISTRLVVSSNWVYATGSPLTLPVGKAQVGNTFIPVYSDRNSYRLPAYHRLDLALILKNRQKPGRKWESEWNLSVYNAYGRKNTWAINFVADEDNPQSLQAVKTYLFSVVPAITYNFKFQAR